MQDAASSCNRSFHMFHKHPRSMGPYALAILFLPRFVGKPFCDHGIAASHHLMDKSAMQALAMSGELAF